MQKSILFDLDGTLSNSGEGIINCVIYALEKFNLPIPPLNELKTFVGPPLREKFIEYGVKEDKAEKAIEFYRERYLPKGIYETKIYDGIENLLEQLKKLGYKLYIATSKPEQMAVTVLKYLNIFKYFDLVCGATLDKSRDSKEKVIKYLLNKTGRSGRIIMVGDTEFDVIGAKTNCIDTVGVSWGYGDVKKLTSSGAIAIANNTDELLKILKSA